jgi:predicted PurR-regulated permease PerM
MPVRWQEGFQRGKDEAWAVCVRILLSYVIIFAMTYAELAIGLSLLQIPGALVIALGIAALDILPVLGTGTVLIPWFLLAFAVGRLSVGIGILILYLVITVVRNLAEPKLVGEQMGLSPVVMLPCMLAGYELFGFAGLFGVPLFVSVLRKLNDRGVICIFR